MATGLEIFGVACNVMQTISFACSLVDIYNKIHAGGSTSPEIETHGIELARATGDLQGHLRRLQSRPLHKDDQEIESVASEVFKTATDLQRELAKYGKDTSGFAKSSALKTVKFLFRKSKVEKLNERLKNYQSIMETRILIKLRTDLIQSTLDEGLATVDARLNNFLVLLQDGQTTLEKLVINTERVQEQIRREGADTRAATKDVVALESSLTREHISSELDAHQSSYVLRDQRERLMKSLKFESMYARENASPINQSHEGTFQWIFDDVSGSDDRLNEKPDQPEPVWSPFTDWLHSDEIFYWISGKPGSGKSSLIRYLTSDPRTTRLLRQRPSAEHTRVLRTFIWAAGEPIQRSQKGVVATLLHQLLSDETISVDQLSKQYGGKTSIVDWSLKELQESLLYILENLLTPVCIFIDGLDEIDPQEFSGLRGLIQIINRWAQIQNIKICLGSRPEPILVLEFAHHSQLRLQDLTKRDMQKHVEESLSQVHERYITDGNLEMLKASIIGQAEGVFLWVSLVTRSIRDGLISDEWDTLLERVKQLPSDLSDLYHDMWNRMNKDDQMLFQSDAASYFSLVSIYPGPSLFGMMLSTKPELRREILAGGHDINEDYLIRKLQIFQRQVQVRCAGLLDVPEVQKGSSSHRDPVHFIHRSAYDFIKDTQMGKHIVQYEKIGWRHLTLWSVIARILEISMSQSSRMSNKLIIALRYFKWYFNDKSLSFMRSVVALIKSMLDRSSTWVEILTEIPLDCTLVSSYFFGYVQHRTQELLASIPRSEESLNLLWHISRELTSAIFAPEIDRAEVLNHVIPTLQLLADSGMNFTFQSSKYLHRFYSHNSALVFFLVELKNAMRKDEFYSVVGMEATLGLLQLLYKIIDSDLDLDTQALLKVWSVHPELKFVYPELKFVSFHGENWNMNNMKFGGLQVLVKVSTRHLLLFEHTKMVDWILSRDASAFHGKLRPLENVSSLHLEAEIIFETSISTGLRCFRNTAQTADIFEKINQYLNSPALESLSIQDINDCVLQLDSLSSDYITSYDGLLQWLIDMGHMPRESELWAQKHSARELLTWHSVPSKESYFQVTEMDWSYKPEYDEFLAVVDEVFEEGE
ncbi:hypothetical protein DM02DRAFT_101777 [Periconia macrospinosa]|uniref:NACHT domain-containing protein n=1 Tax=Periconia macrospinosa TaxID=97972 RepID=A0A2V1DFT2_9PLEO|nr:hypothetical protein DM02DRAFT_101777 [Periconia macrospinosa]